MNGRDVEAGLLAESRGSVAVSRCRNRVLDKTYLHRYVRAAGDAQLLESSMFKWKEAE